MVADEEEFQRASIFAEQQAQLQSHPALENILPQSSDGNPGVNMGTAKVVRDDLQGRFHPRDFRVAESFQSGVEAGIEENAGASHASVFP